MSWQPLLCIFAVLASADAASAQQSQPVVNLGGKALELLTTDESRMQAKIDGEILEEDAFIEVETSFDDGKTGAAVLLVSDGGNGLPRQLRRDLGRLRRGKLSRRTLSEPVRTMPRPAWTRASSPCAFRRSAGATARSITGPLPRGWEQPVAEALSTEARYSWGECEYAHRQVSLGGAGQCRRPGRVQGAAGRGLQHLHQLFRQGRCDGRHGGRGDRRRLFRRFRRRFPPTC